MARRSEAARSTSARLTRRRFFVATAAVAGGGLALAWWMRDRPRLADSPDTLEPNAFLQIRPDGRVVFQLDKVEMGQGTMTGLATLIGEELDFDPARFDVRFAPVHPTFQRPAQVTGQSLSIADSWEPLRETGAAARQMLLTAAARAWEVGLRELETDDGRILHPASGRSAEYREFAGAAAQLSAPWNPELKDPARYRWIGRHVPRLDAELKVTGRAGYGLDVAVPEMLTAVIARCPEIGARIDGFDADGADARPGVRRLVPLAHGVAVVADDFWSATEAARAIRLRWQPGPLATTNDATLLDARRAQFDREPDHASTRGAGAANIREGREIVEAEYKLPYLAHAPLEPMNATVHVRSDRCHVWVPTQAPDICRNTVADLTGLERSQVHVHTTFVGGGFGRRVLDDFLREAVEIAREFEVPVKLVWTREDDMRHGFFRQQTLHRMRGGVDGEGRVLGWSHRQVATPTADLLTPPLFNLILPEALSSETRAGIGRWIGDKTARYVGAFQAREGAAELAYAIDDTAFTQYSHQPGIPISIWRAVGPAYNGFVVESFIDELAFAANADPAGFRRALLVGRPRHLAVLDRLVEMSGWATRGADAGYGLALFESFGTVVGQVARVSVSSGEGDHPVRIRQVWCAVDCGRAINPDIVRAQMESGIVFGATAALHGEIGFDGGRVMQSNFHDYRMLRLADAPAIEVEILPSEEPPSGVGEPGVPPIAPAIANAVFDATGQRLRSLPLRPA